MAGLGQEEYDGWLLDPSQENMAKVIKSLDPMLVTEVQQYSGPKPLLRAKAKGLAVKAVRNYDPTKGAALRTWVTTNMKPLSRYGQRMRSVQVSELATRQAAELNTQRIQLAEDFGREPTEQEVSDFTGISPKRVAWLGNHVNASMSESQITEPTGEGEEGGMPAMSTNNVAQLAAEAVYKDLDPRSQSIYDWKTGSNGKDMLSNQEIAARLGVTPAYISQTSERVADRIRQVADAI